MGIREGAVPCSELESGTIALSGSVQRGRALRSSWEQWFWVQEHPSSSFWLTDPGPWRARCLTPVRSPVALQCSTCSKCFLSRTELRLHEAFKHRGEKLFVCEECGHRASSRNGLQMHIKAKHR